MTATTTDLALDLQEALMAQGLTHKSATQIVRILPPAGRHELFTEMRDNPEAMRELTATFIGALADRLRITHADADVVRSYFRMATA